MAERRNRRRARVVVTLAVAWLALSSGAAYGVTLPPVPGDIALPAGNVVFLYGKATGTQVYRCQPADSGYAWTLFTPAAVLKDAGGNTIIWHYSGPTWRALDGSTVVGARVAGAPAPVPNAIPWLLLKKVSTTVGPTGGTTLSVTTYIHRINTTGGVAPATGCDAAHNGASTSVPYTADYYFSRAA